MKKLVCIEEISGERAGSTSQCGGSEFQLRSDGNDIVVAICSKCGTPYTIDELEP